MEQFHWELGAFKVPAKENVHYCNIFAQTHV